MSENIPQLPQFESEPNDGIDVDYYIGLSMVGINGDTQPFDARFRYRSTDPYAVEVLFGSKDQPVRWAFARDLLLNGVYEPSDIYGDVAVWPTLDERGRAMVAIDLYSRKESANCTVLAPTRELMLFLDQTTDFVPQGHESRFYEVGELTIDEFISH